MPYFRELPDVLYQSNLLHKISSQEYVAIKNIFRRVKIADSAQDQVTLYQKYVIEEKQRLMVFPNDCMEDQIMIGLLF